ncbi:MAG: CHASE2 domain-containing protein [Herminiimonas sp.]|nr:CHASE2 domain-containing protein [Herminiimonas sp.]
MRAGWLHPFVRQLAIREWLLITVAMLLLASALGWQNGLGRLDQTLYDKSLSLNGRPARDDIIIVAIDDYSLKELGRWPWSRRLHAQLIDNLTRSGPRSIGLDVILSEPQRMSGVNADAGDQALAAALARSGRTVIPLVMTNAGAGLTSGLPIASLQDAAAALGHINLEHDSDGVVRKVFLREGQGGQWWPQFAVALSALGATTPKASADEAGPWQRERETYIPFSGNNGHIQSVPYVSVLRGEVPAEFFADKYVLVGATAIGMTDSYPTPVSGTAGAMPGIEIHAQILSALLDHKTISIAAPWQTALFSALPVMLAMLGYLFLSPRLGLLIAALLLGVVLISSYTLQGIGIWFAPSAALIAVLLSYPLWSWRRLEAAVDYLSQEFVRLDQEPHLLPEAAADMKADPMGDALERRIDAMTTAARRVRDLRQFVSDSLDSLPDATLVTAIDGQVLLANRQANEYFASIGEAAIGSMSIVALLTRLDAPQPLDAPAALSFQWRHLLMLEHGALLANGVSVDDKHGRDLLVKSAPCFSATDILTGWIVSLIDISTIRAAERSRDETLRFLSHDMRAPQSSILALLELQHQPESALPLPELFARIETASRRTLGLADNFVQLARAESHEYRAEEVDFTDLLFDATDEMWTLARNKRIELVTDIVEAPYPVRVDRGLMTRALTNLLSNAINYSPEDTRVVCTLRLGGPADAQLTCTLRDQGYGIAEADQARLFQRFQRVDHPDQPRHDGSGLGLVFVKTVIERHQGQISLTSAVGNGSCFTIVLPLAQIDAV